MMAVLMGIATPFPLSTHFTKELAASLTRGLFKPLGRTSVLLVSSERQSLRARANRLWTQLEFAKLWRYGTISVVSTGISLSGLFVFYRLLGLSPTWSNISATCVATVPYYYLNRLWVFKRSGKSHLTKEILPFWTIAFISLVLSTLAVRFAGYEARSISSKDIRAIILLAANFSTYGILWIAKFVIFNRYLFRSHHETAPSS